MPNWEGPYRVKKAFFGKALILTEMDCKKLPNPEKKEKEEKGEAKAKTRKGRFETKGDLS
ncbi:RNA-directed DNA polymerase (Reverse transcriptase), Ribonuclease H [Gossypium australe]|uniref:RNA-directed DNA polymerase (Reverse transcriptase), Ribonuclease H n=1 Tax=Gossypium australe TaxID=47621 RepID=A0A5B6WRP5_9ROSI|nr:RNA-directed DNA polymerase (Reverse transcriptase), Ribonuclease H [Gossypium australe]